MRWQDMPKGKEKYQAYLCSREWGLLRESVKRRNGGKCERCKARAIDHVHHLTYIRCYEELPSDLQGLCKGCHDFVHGRSNVDPAIRREATVEATDGSRKTVRSFYLAGKITKDNWRDEIVGDWSQEQSGSYATAVYKQVASLWEVVPMTGKCPCGALLDYTGPWWSDVNGVYGGHAYNGAFCSPHGTIPDEECVDGHAESIDLFIDSSATVPTKVYGAILRSDLVFAWINSNDCLGTLFEIGLAVSMQKLVVIASPIGFDWRETWLPRAFCENVFGDSPLDAWNTFWERYGV